MSPERFDFKNTSRDENTPLPGTPVRGSTSGRPVMAALDLLGRRWALRIIWELRHGAVGARELQRRCDGMSSSVLYQRLGELQEAALLEKEDGGYALSAIGAELSQALMPLIEWSDAWAEAHRQS